MHKIITGTYCVQAGRYFYIIFFCLLALAVRPAASQPPLQPGRVNGDSIVTAFIPAIAYASDLGLLGGVVVNRYRYHPTVAPYLSLTEVRLSATTKGLFGIEIQYEQMETFGWPVRSQWLIFGDRLLFDNYFGIGNRTTFEEDHWDELFYHFESYRAGLQWQGRINILQSTNRRGRLDVSATAGIRFEIPDDDTERLMGQDRPEGIEGGWVNLIGLGLVWENRDNEFSATRGNRFELSGHWAPGFFFTDFPMVSILSEFRQYVTIPVPYFRPVLAARLSGEWAGGTLPYWKRPYLGDELTLRGYPTYRFRGDAVLFYNLELRTWIYELPEFNFKLGIHGFHDAGRVFYEEEGLDGWHELFRDYHRTFGGGVATSFLTPDFVLRFDLGISDEMYRFYMNVGYMF
ncbi:MAG: BamA/TamA family outer membrane protein [Balneolales bacterium]